MPGRSAIIQRAHRTPDGAQYNTRMDITLPQLEHAINYWRARRPSTGEECALSAEVNALATVYATMIFKRAHAVPLDALDSDVRKLLEAVRQPMPPGA